MSDVLLLNADGTPLSQVPLSAVSWQTAVRHMYQGKVKVLKEYDDWVIRSQYFEMKVPSIVIMTKQVKWGKTLKYSRQNVYIRDDFTCQLQYTSSCKAINGKVKPTELTIDHVVPRSRGGKTTWKNVCASCKDCNSAKGDNALILPKKKPHVPNYYEILAKRKSMPIIVRDIDWKYYIDWPDELIVLS